MTHARDPLETTRLDLLHTVRGLERLLQDCCDGHSVHQVASLRTALTLMEGLLTRPVTEEILARIRARLEPVKREAVRIYRVWDSLRRAG